MSELFEALKKIQKGERTTQGTTPPFVPSSKRKRPLGKGLTIATLIVAIALLGGLGLLHYTKGINRPFRITSSPPLAKTPVVYQKPPLIPQKANAQIQVAQKEEEQPGALSIKHQIPLSEKEETSIKVETAQKQHPVKAPEAIRTPHKTSATPKEATGTAKKEAYGSSPSTLSPETSQSYHYTYLLMSANEAMGKGNIQKALELYQDYVVKNPKNSKVWNNIGVIYLRMGEPRRALTALQKAHSLNPEDPEIAVNRAIALWENGKKDIAQREAETLRLRDDLPPLAVYNLAVLLIHMDMTEEAYALVQRSESRLGHMSLLVSLHPYFRGLGGKTPNPAAKNR